MFFFRVCILCKLQALVYDILSSRKTMLGVCLLCPLPASLSGTFLQTLRDLVTPLKGHSLGPRSCPATRSAPSQRLGYKTVEDCPSTLYPSLISLVVSVDVKHHVYLLTYQGQ